MTATLVHTSSRQLDAQLAIARIAASGRVQAERLRAEAKAAAELEAYHAELDAAMEQGQWFSQDGLETYCYVCRRATDHWGEHSDEQIAAWRADRGL
jgi:hypothetical protein